MVTDKTIEIVKSTAPILDEHGETLTKHFYGRMFSHNPEVLPFFNPANQAAGKQQRALAAAICAYAKHIDNLDVLGNAVSLIAHKHVSLQVKPEHYPIVGENLLASIREVLGEGATDDVINAWAEAYGFLVDILVGAEAGIYEANSGKTGGWEGFRALRIAKIVPESSVISSFHLVPEDGGPLPSYEPGQYVTLRVPTADGSTTMRNYSLSDQPGQGHFRISVKRETGDDGPDGVVSNMLHKQMSEGDVLEIAPPCGDFCLDNTTAQARPLVLLAAGVGITPILSMLKTAVATMPDRKIVVVHGALDEQKQAFKAEIDAICANSPNVQAHYRYSEVSTLSDGAGANCSTGFVDAALLETFVPDHDADFYFCGPKPFMACVNDILAEWNVPSDRIKLEFFGPLETL